MWIGLGRRPVGSADRIANRPRRAPWSARFVAFAPFFPSVDQRPAEIDVVRTRRLWPRSLVQPPLTEGDEKAYEAYVEEEKRRRPEVVDVCLEEEVRRGQYAGRSAGGNGRQH